MGAGRSGGSDDVDEEIIARYGALPPERALAVPPISVSMLAAVRTLAEGLPSLQTALRNAAAAQTGLEIVFTPGTMRGIANGSIRLMETKSGAVGIAISAQTNRIVEQGRVVEVTRLVGRAAVPPSAALALPMIVAGAAAYLQQQELEKTLASIQAVVDRLEERLDDQDTGVCLAAERLLLLLHEARADGGSNTYLRTELAVHRAAVEALYASRRQWIARFKADLERQQNQREESGRCTQPWVEIVTERVREGRLEKEVTLFVRALLTRTRLAVVTAAVLAEEGHGSTAAALLQHSEEDLRREFYDLHRRLRPLAVHSPELNRVQRLPGMGKSIRQAHETIQTLVTHLDHDVLPFIPDATHPREVPVMLGPEAVRELTN